jgi:site-specific recombinase XerD
MTIMASTKQSTKKKRLTLPALIEYYEVCNRSENKSHQTISWYTANLKQFQHYLRSRKLSTTIDTITLQTLREYQAYLLKRDCFGNNGLSHQLSPAAVHGHIRTLKAFFNWLTREELIIENPAILLRPPKVPQKVTTTLNDQEIKTILNAFDTRIALDMRNKAIFTLLLDTGIRVGELVGLKMEGLHLSEGYFKVCGKGNKERIIPVGNSTQRLLQGYLFRYRSIPVRLGIENVFLTSGGKPMTVNSAKLLFHRLGKKTGVVRLHAHLCRHTFATRFLINGGDVFSLQQILGHSTLEMVRHYVNLAASHVMIQHNRYSPMDHLS